MVSKPPTAVDARGETPAERTERVAPFAGRHAYEPSGPGGAWCGRCGKAARVGLHLPTEPR